MRDTPEASSHSSKAEYGSDVIVDILRSLKVDYVALNPGATFRGLHDSLVNYGGNRDPEIILCTHEEVAVAIAEGYGRAAGKPMAAAVHNIVGLLHASMAIFNAWVDRASMLVLGGTGPMASEQRRPWIDWIHTALVQGTAVRDFVKWDDQPASVPGFAESLLRAYQLTTTEPKGPVYICFDAALQEQRLEDPFSKPDVSRYAKPTRVQADPQALEQTAELLLAADRPVVIADYLGKAPEAVDGLIRLAEALALPVIDMGDLFNFPSQHDLNLTDAAGELLKDADVVVALDVFDLHQALTSVDRVTRSARELIPPSARIIDISLRHYAVRSWVADYGKLQPVDVSISADTAMAVPSLADACLRKLHESPNRAPVIKARRARLESRRRALARATAETAQLTAKEQPIALPFLAQQVFEVVKDHDWVVTRDMQGWCRRLWDVTQAHQYVSSRGGGGLGRGLGNSLGVALANLGKGRLCVDFQADGDLLFTDSALWTAAHHRIPLLVIVYNNRSYYNDEEHQADMAKSRQRPVENRVVGIRIEDPVVDFASVARSFGVHGEGPIEHPDDLRPALERAMEVVVGEGLCALVDVVTQNR
ncbi:MAG: thiamine pyrophosphate-binding protein [Chloroflexi bacterium]|nr:thiamine pyrophosphate-binding protein [Chloroflexota bacterium]